MRQADGRYARYELVSCKCVDTYVRLKGNQNQICWKWRKVGHGCTGVLPPSLGTGVKAAGAPCRAAAP